MEDIGFDQDILDIFENEEKKASLTQQKEKDDIAVYDHELKDYYNKLFPYELYFKWFGNGNTSYFEKREFSFTKKGDIYMRFLSFRDAEELKREIIKANPIKIDVGAVYNTLPKYRSSSGQNFIPTEKELVFDIDMTDYDDVRTCCSDAKVCNKCWKFMIIAYKILNAALKDDFGFENLMWVFSGRRGIHCWVADDKARKLTNEGRASIANYLSWKKVSKVTGITSLIRKPIHPSYLRALSIIDSHFVEFILEGQNIFNDKKIIELVQVILKAYFENKRDYSKMESEYFTLMNKKISSIDKWNQFKTLIDSYEKESKDPKLQLCIYDIQMAIVYPRLDINVSKHINHLLKSPFSVHPKTGLISVPLDEDLLINFDMNKIPSLKESLQDFESGKRGKFDKYIEIFESIIPTK